MLVLSRHRDESIMIGNDAEVVVVDIRGDKVRLGIKAPKSIPVHRKEVYENIQEERSKDAANATDGILIIDEAKLRRLREISRMTALYHSQLDGLASECCEIFGQPDDHSNESDTCREIVDHSANVEATVAKLIPMLAIKNANRMLDEASDEACDEDHQVCGG